MDNRQRPPSDPNVAAHAAINRIVGEPESKPLPAHVTVAGGVAACGKCGETYALSKRANAREEDLRAFGVLHRH